MKKELPEKQIKNFLEQVFRGEMRLNKKSWKRFAISWKTFFYLFFRRNLHDRRSFHDLDSMF